jgi:hypothetical protein
VLEVHIAEPGRDDGLQIVLAHVARRDEQRCLARARNA